MIDHLMEFESRQVAAQVLGGSYHEESGRWLLPANVILNIGGANDESVRVILSEAVWDRSDPMGPVLVTPEVLASGWYCIVACDAIDPALRDLPDQACRLIADRDAALAGQPFIRFVAADMPQELLASARVEPTPAGANYPFG